MLHKSEHSGSLLVNTFTLTTLILCRSSFLLSTTSSWVKGNSPSIWKWEQRWVNLVICDVKNQSIIYVVFDANRYLSQRSGSQVSNLVVGQGEKQQGPIQPQALTSQAAGRQHLSRCNGENAGRINNRRSVLPGQYVQHPHRQWSWTPGWVTRGSC